MKQKIYLLIFLSFCISTKRFSQNTEWIVYDTTNSDLPSNHIDCIAIDESGNKWIGTDKGLVKYDGFSWEIYDTTNSELPSNWIFCIAIDKSDNKWIGTSEGLVKFDDFTWTVYDTTNSGLPANRINKIVVDNYGNKWLGQVRAENWQLLGLVKFDDFTWTVYDTTNSGLPSNYVWSLAIDADNNKWIGTSNYLWGPCCGEGLVKFNDTTWTLYNNDNSGLPSNNIVDIEIDQNGSKWILSGEETGLTIFDDATCSIFAETIEQHDDYWCLAIDSDDNKWIGLNGTTTPTDYGILKFDGTEWVAYGTKNSELPSEHVRCISIDKYNNKWIGTSDWEYSGGLAVYNEGGVITDVENEIYKIVIPNDYVLYQNYPNPFNPSTTINYSIPNMALSSLVTLKVFDILGREITTLVNQKQKPGLYQAEWDANNFSSGIYFYQLTAGNFTETKKMILLR